MKYIDSNIIIRLIVNDVPELAQEAIKILEDADAQGEDLVIFDAVITEVCFVLEFNQSYRLPRQVIFDGLYAVLDNLGVRRGDCTDRALEIYVTHPKLDYVDCLLLAASHGKRADVLTFEMGAKNIPSRRLLQEVAQPVV